MLRHILLLLARSHQVKEIVTRLPVSSGIVNRYVPGEETVQAVDASRSLIEDGLHVTLDFLGEDTLDEA
ncbi:MAG: fadM [Marmoricola sp.]|nr:fadM [Marmoricola sp.]